MRASLRSVAAASAAARPPPFPAPARCLRWAADLITAHGLDQAFKRRLGGCRDLGALGGLCLHHPIEPLADLVADRGNRRVHTLQGAGQGRLLVGGIALLGLRQRLQIECIEPGAAREVIAAGEASEP